MQSIQIRLARAAPCVGGVGVVIISTMISLVTHTPGPTLSLNLGLDNFLGLPGSTPHRTLEQGFLGFCSSLCSKREQTLGEEQLSCFFQLGQRKSHRWRDTSRGTEATEAEPG